MESVQKIPNGTGWICEFLYKDYCDRRSQKLPLTIEYFRAECGSVDRTACLSTYVYVRAQYGLRRLPHTVRNCAKTTLVCLDSWRSSVAMDWCGLRERHSYHSCL